MNLLLLLLAPALAGDTTHEVELSGGGDWLARTDQMFSPLPHDGLAPTVGLGWSPRGRRDASVLRLSVTMGDISSGPAWTFTRDRESRETFPSAITLADLQYAYGRRIDGDRWTLHVGATSANHFENLVNAMAILGVESYFGVFELGPWVDWRLQVADGQALELEAWSPVLGWVARNPYAMHSGEHIWNTRDNKPVNIIFRYLGDGSLQTVDTYRAVHLRAGYSLAVSDVVTLFARGRADGFHHTTPWPLTEWQLGLDLGLRGTF